MSASGKNNHAGTTMAERTIPVEIVRPKRAAREWLVTLAAQYAGLFAATYTTMLLIGACHHEISAQVPALGYLQTLLGLFTIKCVVGITTAWDAYKLWSRDPR